MASTWYRNVVVWGTLVAGVAGEHELVAGKPSPPPFAVQYRIQFLTHPERTYTALNRINSAGVAACVSYRGQGYLFDSETDNACWDIAELLSAGDRYVLPEGAILSVGGISDNGKIAGTVWSADGSTGWAYVLDTNNDLASEATSFTILGNGVFPEASGTRAYGVNDCGDVLGLYIDGTTGETHLFLCNQNEPANCLRLSHLATRISSDSRRFPSLNGWGQVVGQMDDGVAFRYTPYRLQSLELFPEVSEGGETVTDMNDDGVFCGTMLVPRNKSINLEKPYRCYDTSGENTPTMVDAVSHQAYFSSVRINGSCDLLVHEGWEARIYHDTSGYTFTVESLVDLSGLTTEELALWKIREPLWVNDITDRYPVESPETLGRLCGSLQYYVGNWTDNSASRHVGVVLTPVYP
jgi:hypothetical protein